MPAAFNFGGNARVSARVQDVRKADRHYQVGFIAARLSAGSSLLELNLAPKVALQLARELEAAALAELSRAAPDDDIVPLAPKQAIGLRTYSPDAAQRCFDQGKACKLRGGAIAECPYKKNGQHRRWWVDGWVSAI